MDPIAILIWILVGALGGFFHWIMPVRGDMPRDWVELVKRIIAGAVLVPVIFATADGLVAVFPWILVFVKLGYLGGFFMGYFAIDIWKVFRDYFQVRREMKNE